MAWRSTLLLKHRTCGCQSVIERILSNTVYKTSLANGPRFQTQQARPLSKLSVKDSMFENPVDELQRYVEVPLLEEGEINFVPEREHMEYAETLFMDISGRNVFRVARARKPEDCPHTRLPEIAMMGYSNVGKSSLIKALFYRCPRLQVRTSKRPGHTRTVDFFKVHDDFVLVDMPGYGYKQPEAFATTVGSYLSERKNIRCAFLLVNPEQGLRPEDSVVMQKLERLHIDYALVMTKIDLFSKAHKIRFLMEVRRLRDTFSREYCFPQPFLVSSITGEGLGYLQAFIARLCQKI